MFHFTPNAGWINDPHGITYRDGEYHAFFQFVPDQAVWGVHCHWGHAIGRDLLSLRELPAAIAPGDGDAGIWSGSLVTTSEQRTVIFYTTASGLGSSAHARIRQAFPTSDDWKTWAKGPVVVDAPADVSLSGFRDPFIRREGDQWRMFVGAGDSAGIAMAMTYTSTDLDTWDYDGVALQRSTEEIDPVWMGTLWECPQVFEIDGRAVMVSSVWENNSLHYAGYALGSYTEGRFTADAWGQLTWGDSYYAPSYFRDDQERPCMMFWMRGVEDQESGWAGALSIPFILSIEDDRLVAAPHPDIMRYRQTEALKGVIDGLAADVVWEEAAGDLTITSGARPLVILRRNDDGSMTVDAQESTTFPVNGDVRIIIDGPVMEVSSRAGMFATRVSPTSVDLNVTATGGTVTVHGLSAEPAAPIPSRPTHPPLVALRPSSP